MTFIQELGLAEVIVGDFASFASGNQLSTTKTVGGLNITAGVVHLPNGPTGTGYTPFSGSLLQVFGMAFADIAIVTAGAPVMIAEKFGNSWFGLSLSATPVGAPAPAAALATAA